MKIAYLVLAHTNPRLLARTIQRLSSEDVRFYIHVDRKADQSLFESIRGENVLFCESRVRVYWGDFSQVEAILVLLRTAMGNWDPDYCVLISGSDYPLRSGRYIQRFLEENTGSEFINLIKVPAPGKPLSRVTLADLQAFAEQLGQGSLKPASQNRAMTVLKSLLSFAQQTGYLPFNVAGAVK